MVRSFSWEARSRSVFSSACCLLRPASNGATITKRVVTTRATIGTDLSSPIVKSSFVLTAGGHDDESVPALYNRAIRGKK